MYRLIATVFAIVCVPICIAGILCFESNMEDVFQWLPDTSRERDVYDQFIAKFGADDFVVISWPECKLENDQVEKFSRELESQDTIGYLSHAVAGQEILKLLQQKVGVDRELLRTRFRGFYVGPDDAHTCVIVTLSERGMDQRKASMRLIKQVAQNVLKRDVTDVEANQLWVAGNPEMGAYGDQLILDSMKYRVVPSCLIATLIAWFCLRSFKLTVLVLVVAGLGALLSIAVVTLSGAKWGGLSAIIPTLAFLMGVSGALHLVNYAHACDGNGQKSLAHEILAVGWKPCLFSSLTTAIGMMSLYRSDFPAVRHFGVFCACGVLLSMVCQLLLIPNAIAWQRDSLYGGSQPKWPPSLLELVLRFRWVVVFGCGLLTLAFAFGLTRLKANMEVERAFRSTTPVMKNIAQLESSLGPVEQTEIVVTFPHAPAGDLLARVAAIRQIQTRLKQVPKVHGVLSFADSLPEEPHGRGFTSVIARGAYKHAVERAMEELGDSPYVFSSEAEESWRISIRVPFLETIDFARLAVDVQAVTTTSLKDAGWEDGQVSVQYTGVSHLYYVAQEAVVGDLFANFTLAFCVICPLMIFAFRSVIIGMTAMLPNLVPTVFVFGGLGLAGYQIDLGIAMTASVALGIAVDDTTHFLIRFQELGRNSNSTIALQKAFAQCSTAMFNTTLIAGLALSVYIGGPLAAMTRFAVLLVSLLFVALICDLFLLPALLQTLGLVSTLPTSHPSSTE